MGLNAPFQCVDEKMGSLLSKCSQTACCNFSILIRITRILIGDEPIDSQSLRQAKRRISCSRHQMHKAFFRLRI